MRATAITKVIRTGEPIRYNPGSPHSWGNALKNRGLCGLGRITR
jgi:hypothetical protein